MDYRLLYTQRALNDLAEIIGHIATTPKLRSACNSLLDHVGLLARFPRMGSVIRNRPRVRKLLHSPILAYYQVHEDNRVIEILHFRHGARKAPESELRK